MSIYFKDKISQIGVLKVPENESYTLFRLAPLFDRLIRKDIFFNPEIKMSDLMPQLTKIYDSESKEEPFNPEFMSVNFLEKNVKNIEKVIFPLAVGKPVIAIGDRPSVKIITQTFFFKQHLSVEIIDWLSTENQIGLNITGMSKEKYSELLKLKAIDKYITTINLNEKKIQGEFTSTYFKKIYDQVKKKSPVLIYAVIGSELKKITELAIQINSLALLEKEIALKRLQQIKSEINNDSKFRKIIYLALERNPFLESILKKYIK